MSRSMQVTWKEQQRGSTLKLIFSIRSVACTNYINTKSINIDNLALVRFKFRVNSTVKCRLEPSVSFKKHEMAKNSRVNITVSYAKFEKQCPCADYWIEYIKLDPAVDYDKDFRAMSTNILLFVLEVSITVHDHTSEPLHNKLYEDTKLTDFNLKAVDGMVAVHKVILGVNSYKFRLMLNDPQETEDGHFYIEGVTIKTLQHLKEYMYLKTLPEDWLQLQQLLLVAMPYCMVDLKTDCITKLVKLVTLDNFNALIYFACQNNVPALMEAIATEIPDSIVDGINEKKKKKVIKTEDN